MKITHLETRLWFLQLNAHKNTYDENGSPNGMLVRASTKYDARGIASVVIDEFGRGVWLSSKSSSCRELHPQGKPELILASFNAG